MASSIAADVEGKGKIVDLWEAIGWRGDGLGAVGFGERVKQGGETRGARERHGCAGRDESTHVRGILGVVWRGGGAGPVKGSFVAR